MKIKIVAVPPGDAPFWVRSAWVGLVLPTANNVPKIGSTASGVLGGTVTPSDVKSAYLVDTRTAIRILRKKSPKAAQWWDKLFKRQLRPPNCLGFPRDIAEFADD